MRLRLPHDETDERKRYTMPDPDELAELYSKAYRAVWHMGEPMTIEQAKALLSLAGGYLTLTLTTYELGQECCVGKLRDIWRARRARDAKSER